MLLKSGADANQKSPGLLGCDFSPNQSLCELRSALDPSKKNLGCNGINAKVSLCVNEDGKPRLIKGFIVKNKLHTLIK